MHYVKSVQIRSFFWSVFSCIRTEYGDLRSKLIILSKRTCSKSSSIKYGFQFLIYSVLLFLSYLFDVIHSINHNKVKLTAKRRPFSSVTSKDISYGNLIFSSLHQPLISHEVLGRLMNPNFC